MDSIKIATVFSGIGAAEQALNQMNIKHKVLFACDNGERELQKDFKQLSGELTGLSQEAINSQILNEYDATGKINYVKLSYLANYSDVLENWYEDIRFLDGKIYKNKIDILIGGSPCQSFSTYGKRLGLEDTRGTLFYDYARLVKETNPKAFIFENVTGLLNHDKGKTWDIIYQVFQGLNYNVYFDVLNAENYNLPQMRKRLFVVGFRKDIDSSEFRFPSKVELTKFADEYLEKDISNNYYLGYKGFRYVTSNERNEGRARVNRKIIGCQTANQQFNWTGDFRVESPKEEHLNDKRIYVGEYLGVPAVARKLTPRECLNLMGFKDFNIVVKDTIMYRQVGNSIAVPVISGVIENILEVIKNE